MGRRALIQQRTREWCEAGVRKPSGAENRIRNQSYFVNTGEKLRLTKIVRSQKTGMLLPKEGTLVYITENFGRRLLLVAFDDGNCEYLFDEEVESATCESCVRGIFLPEGH